jgi:hypothetical protein
VSCIGLDMHGIHCSKEVNINVLLPFSKENHSAYIQINLESPLLVFMLSENLLKSVSEFR